MVLPIELVDPRDLSGFSRTQRNCSSLYLKFGARVYFKLSELDAGSGEASLVIKANQH